MLKLKINKATYDALGDVVKAEYKADGMDYVLDLEGYEDPVELKRAKDREKQRADDEKAKRVTAETRVTELETELHDETTAGARKKGDIATLEKSWQGKLDAAKAEGAAAVDKLKASLKRTMVDGTAEALAKVLSTAPAVLLPHIKSRLALDFEGDEPALRVVGADGKPSALTLAELQAEFIANADFSAIIIGSKAAGGGASGGKQSGGGATKKLSEMNETERTAYQKANPEAFKKEAAELPTVRI